MLNAKTAKFLSEVSNTLMYHNSKLTEVQNTINYVVLTTRNGRNSMNCDLSAEAQKQLEAAGYKYSEGKLSWD